MRSVIQINDGIYNYVTRFIYNLTSDFVLVYASLDVYVYNLCLYTVEEHIKLGNFDLISVLVQ